MSAFELRVEEAEAPQSTIVLAGEFDSGACDELAAAVDRQLADSRVKKLVLDLQALTFIDSAGMRALLMAGRRAQERSVELELVPAPEEVTALLTLAGLTARMKLVADGDVMPGAEEFLERIELELDREPAAPAKARAEVRELLGPRLGDQELANVVLLTSELVTNAVIHPREDSDRRLGLRLALYSTKVRVEVDDPGEGFDPNAEVEPSEGGGRGLMLVDHASSRWSVGLVSTPRGRRFAVWFEIDFEEAGARALGG